MSLIPGVRIDPRLRIDPWIGFTPDVSSGLLKCTRSGTTAKLLRMMDLTARIRHILVSEVGFHFSWDPMIRLQPVLFLYK